MKKYIIILWIIIFLLITQFSSNFKSSTLAIKTIPVDFKYDWCSLPLSGGDLEEIDIRIYYIYKFNRCYWLIFKIKYKVPAFWDV